jgi:hypothetical protein
MTNPAWAPALWSPTPWVDFPEEPPEPETDAELDYDAWAPAVYQAADWTCSCAASAWLLNSVGDERSPWDEWDVVRGAQATYRRRSPAYGPARATWPTSSGCSTRWATRSLEAALDPR